jgi:hypothetical protein
MLSGSLDTVSKEGSKTIHLLHDVLIWVSKDSYGESTI